MQRTLAKCRRDPPSQTEACISVLRLACLAQPAVLGCVTDLNPGWPGGLRPGLQGLGLHIPQGPELPLHLQISPGVGVCPGGPSRMWLPCFSGLDESRRLGCPWGLPGSRQELWLVHGPGSTLQGSRLGGGRAGRHAGSLADSSLLCPRERRGQGFHLHVENKTADSPGRRGR